MRIQSVSSFQNHRTQIAVLPQEMDTFSLYLNFIKLPIKLCDNLRKSNDVTILVSVSAMHQIPTFATVCSLSHKPCHLTDSHTLSRLKPNSITVQELYTHRYLQLQRCTLTITTKEQNAWTEMEDNHIVVKPTRREPLLLE